METVYLETTFISYLTSRSSGDLIVAAHQKTSNDWWVQRRQSFECFISPVVIDEISAGDPIEAQKRRDAINGIPALTVTSEADSLTQLIMASRILPPNAFPDAAHISIAAFHSIDYLLTWNCKLLANAQIERRIEEVCKRLGYRMPVICTPEALMVE